MRSLIMVGSFAGAIAAGVVLACGTSGDGSQESGADITASTSSEAGAKEAGADSPAVAAQKRLAGAWVPTSADSEVLAVVILPSAARLRVNRDVAHKALTTLDKAEVDRTTLNATVLSFDGTSRGKLEMTLGLFLKGQSLRQIEDYDFEIQSDGDKDTLTLTETSEQLVQTIVVKDAGPKTVQVDGGPITLRPALQLTRAPSWCARVRNAADGSDDCADQFRNGAFKPTDMPAECEGNEDLCMSCDGHRCKTHDVSSCELARNICVTSIESCEFDNGFPAGQVASIDTDGHPIDCDKSPTGKKVCCQDLTGNNGDR
jgi:hypothetical protein